jgi:hypothetical protein
MYYIGNAACVSLSWQQHSIVGPCTDLLFNATLPRWHDRREETFWTLILLNNMNSSMARSEMTDVVAMVMEE